MSDLSQQISQAALEALKDGQGDPSRVVSLFREKVPYRFYFPSDPTPNDLASFKQLLEIVIAEHRIWHGRPTTEFPGVIALSKTVESSFVAATGFLISSDIVVTAGHALDDGINVGIWRHDSDGNPIRLFPISELPEEKQRRSDTHDIGLIRLSQPVADVEIRSVASRDAFDASRFLTIVGFGFDENGNFGIKKTAIVNRRIEPIAGVTTTADQFILGDPAIAKDGDACFRDSGGPVLVENGRREEIAGLISGPVKEGVCGDGTICLHLDGLTGWIDDNIRDLGGQQRPA